VSSIKGIRVLSNLVEKRMYSCLWSPFAAPIVVASLVKDYLHINAFSIAQSSSVKAMRKSSAAPPGHFFGDHVLVGRGKKDDLRM
jgi:hypothetical protein